MHRIRGPFNVNGPVDHISLSMTSSVDASAPFDVTGVDVSPGDEVVIIGRQGEESWQQIDAREMAALIGTIPWEVVCRLGTRIGARPRLRAGESVLDPDAVPGAGDERDGVGFGFLDAVTAGGCRARRVGDGVVQVDVAELVG